MAEIINLRRVKKQRARTAAGQEAAENRVRHGQTRAERDASAQQREAASRKLDGAALAGDGEPPE